MSLRIPRVRKGIRTRPASDTVRASLAGGPPCTSKIPGLRYQPATTFVAFTGSQAKARCLVLAHSLLSHHPTGTPPTDIGLPDPLNPPRPPRPAAPSPVARIHPPTPSP